MQILNREAWLAGVILAMLGVLGGCSKAEHAAPAAAHAANSGVKKTAGGTALELADMVSAVSSGKAASEVDLKFALRERPVAGEAVDIDVAVILGKEFDQVSARFSSPDGLEVISGAGMPQADHPEPGAPISHTLTVVPQRDGIYFVNATVQTDSSTSSVTHLFSIPVIVGAGIAAPAASAAASAPATVRPPAGSR